MIAKDHFVAPPKIKQPAIAVRLSARYLSALFGLALLLWGIWVVGRDGYSYWLTAKAVEREQRELANRAISLNPSNPDAHQARASLFGKIGDSTAAIIDLERAIELRPRDHYLWVELGYSRYLGGDFKGAIADFREAVRLAPFYAQPRWYLGNVLIQLRSLDEGFAELRRAAVSDPAYVADAIMRADDIYQGNPAAVLRAVQPQTSTARLALALHFIKQNHRNAAMELFRAGGELTPTDRDAFLAALLSARMYTEAYEVWSVKERGRSGVHDSSLKPITDGGFEREIDPEAIGFQWRIARPPEFVRVSLDASQPAQGEHSLRVDFNGNSRPQSKIISQLVLIEPNARYHLSFAARTRKLISGGLPLITVTDPENGRALAQSKPFPEDSSEWQSYEMEFVTGPATYAVFVNLQRQNCPSSPCPIFGQLWLDNLEMKQL